MTDWTVDGPDSIAPVVTRLPPCPPSPGPFSFVLPMPIPVPLLPYLTLSCHAHLLSVPVPTVNTKLVSSSYHLRPPPICFTARSCQPPTERVGLPPHRGHRVCEVHHRAPSISSALAGCQLPRTRRLGRLRPWLQLRSSLALVNNINTTTDHRLSPTPTSSPFRVGSSISPSQPWVTAAHHAVEVCKFSLVASPSTLCLLLTRRITGRSREGLYEPVLADSEREAVADLLQYLENVCASKFLMNLAATTDLPY